MSSSKVQMFLSLAFSVSVASADSAIWSAGSAYTIPKGRWEVGLFQPLRHGQTDRLEWSTHPLWNILIPNLSIKVAWPPLDNWTFASRHTLFYPTPLLRKITHEGKFGIISPEFTIPHMVSIRNELLLTRRLGRSGLMTGRTGVALGFASESLDERNTIDLPLVFPRLADFYSGYGVHIGLDILRRITGQIDYLIDADIILHPGISEAFAFEHKGLFIWNRSSQFRINFGYKLVYGEYPFGTQWHLFPLFDLQWGW